MDRPRRAHRAPARAARRALRGTALGGRGVRLASDAFRRVEVAPPGATTTIALAPPREGDATGGRETGIAFHTDDIEALYADLKEKGVDVDAEISRMGGGVPPMFWLRDREGNSLMAVEVS